MPVRDAIATMRRDPRWKSKVGVGLLVNLVPYVGMFVLRGWLIDHQRNVAWGVEDGLPEWGDWIERAKNGLFGMLPGFVYTYAVSFVAAVPLMGLILVASIGMAASASASASSSSPGPEFLGFLGVIWVGTMLWVLALTCITLPLVQVPEARYALWRDLGMAFQWKVTWNQIRAGGKRFRRAWGFGVLYIGCVLLALTVPLLPLAALPFTLSSGEPSPATLALALAGVVLGVALYLVALVIAVPASIVQAHLWGEWAREAYDLEHAPVQP